MTILVFAFLPLRAFAGNEILDEIDKKLKNLQIQLEELKLKARQEDFLNWLINCESRGNIKAINTNDRKITGYPSFGILQFQPKTLLTYGKKYELLPEEFSLKETMLIIWNPNLQKEIATKMIEDEEFKHWKTCYKKYPNKKSLLLEVMRNKK